MGIKLISVKLWQAIYKKKTMIKGRVPHNHIMRFCGARREKFLDLQVSTWMCFHYVKRKQQISMRQDNRTELMWITNVHKKYHHKVYGYTYIQYIEICTGTIHTFFFSWKYLMGAGAVEKYTLILSAVYNLCL